MGNVLTLSYHPIASIEGFASQDGTLNGSATSAENFDMAVATVTISEISGKNIIVSESSANFVNQTAVVVLTPHKSYQGPGGTAGISSLVVSVLMDIPEVGTVTEEIGPITISGELPYYFSLPSQSLLADFLAARYSLTASEISTLLASATITFTGQQYGVYYLTCDKTGYKFAAGKYYKLDENNFVMTEVIKRSAAGIGIDVYVENQDLSWSNAVTFAVNRGIGWRVDGDYVFWGDKQLYVVDDFDPMNPFEGWVRASDDVKHREATYSLRDPEPPSVTYTAPTIVSSTLTYNGSGQALVTGGSATGGTIYYSYDYTPYSGSASSSDWSTTVPAPTNAGTYTVYYKVEPAAGYTGGVESTSLGSKVINKANGWVSLSPSSGGDFNSFGHADYYVSVNSHGGSLSYTKSGTNSDNVSVEVQSGTIVRIWKPNTVAPGQGTTVTITSAATNNYNAASANFSCN